MSAVVIWINFSNQKTFVEKVFMNQATQTTYQYFDSVNTMMITGTMENREILRKKLLENKEILDVRIVRGPEVKKLFGPGFPYESPQDDYDKKALKGEAIKLIQTNSQERTLTIISPFRASTNYRGTNCIECHQVPAGTVLGAARITYSLKNVDKEVQVNLYYVGKILVALFILALFIVVFLVRIVAVNKLKHFQITIEKISSDLDLTTKISQNESQDEVGKMSSAFDEMLETIRGSLSQVKQASDQIVLGTEEITIIANETIADSREQKEETRNVASTLAKMSDSALDVANNTNQSKQFTNNVEQEVNDGTNKAHSAREKINELFNKIELVSSIAEKLEEETKQISNTVKVIDDITLKTRLLSFNASVEAARSGEHGKGFAVVAQEIGELANQTKNSNLEIERGTVQLKSLMEEAVTLIRSTKILAEDGKNEVNISYDSFRNVSDEMAKLKSVMTSIAKSTEEQNQSTKDVEKNINAIMDLSSKTTTAAERIGVVCSDFSKLAIQLEELINKFKI